ncbi:MAG: PKD domain-containing protein, partial [Bacteroidia bacterium]|nr:PKD domain-containing protein [Bacteroidia bacterium]
TWGNINQGQVSVQNTICPKLCTKFVTINAIPTGIITIGDSSCKGDTVRLYGPPGYTYSWTPGGSTNQSLLVTTSGTYSLVISQNGCSTTLNYNIGTFPKKPKPNVNISWNCMASPTTPVPYYMAATINPNWSYQWSPITAIPVTSDTTYQHYSSVFNSTHQVIVTDQNGCKDTASVTLNQQCTVTGGGGGGNCVCDPIITVNYDPCFGQFTLTTSGATIGAYYWNFTDGDYSNLQNPQHWFADTGFYSITVAVYCTSGCWKSIKQTIYVPYILRPKIRHTFPVTCNYNFIQLSYKPSSKVKGAAVSYTTDWDDGSPLTTGILPKTHNYSAAGTYYVQHTVSYLGCVKTVYDTVVIKPFKADFGFCDSGCIGQSIQFVDKSTSWSPIVHWGWNFGDATTSNIQSPFHIYSLVGNYNVQLIIQNQQGCKDTANYLIHTTTFNPPGLTYTVVNGTQTGTTFNICEGGYVVATAPFSPSYTYAWNDGKFGFKDTIKTSGVYWVNVTNNHGCIKKLGPFTVIVNPNPNATILSADSSCSSFATSLLALNGLGYTYNWNLNPGAFTATGNPGTFYSVPAGNYNAYLSVVNSFGCTAKDTLPLTILQGPLVTVTPSFTTICEGNVAVLTSTIVGPYTSLQWSNGAITNYINVINTGNYILSVTDAFGCVGQDNGYVQVNPKPDLSNIPSGCYELCMNQMGVAKICGPMPLFGETFSYNWLLNNVSVSTNQNLTLNANGNYQLIVVNTNTGCADTSDVFSVNFVTGAVANIGSTSPNPTICIGSGACITLTAQGAQNNVLYTWWWNNSWLGTGTSIQACNPGTYILHAYRSHCCQSWDTIVIDEGDCCFNPSDTSFHLIQDSTVYTTNQWWDGKYYVAGRVYVRNKAVLDMTTIDVVFDRDGEIIFEDSSVVRATNSVFRPCDMHDVWVGFTFKDSSSGFIHTNTFKNAKHAIDISTTGPEAVKITDNVFTDCHKGVRVSRGVRNYNQGITGNSFVVSDYNFTTPGLYPNFDYFGIELFGTKMDEIVSQNKFRNSDRSGQNNRFYGIYLLRSYANISENTFTNMYRSIDVSSNIGLVNIENNEIEKNFQGKFSSDVQIRVTNSDMPLLVYANELRNSDNKYAKTVGIFSENTFALNIRDNNIKGYDVGIWTRRTKNAVVNENDIDLAGDIGILDSLSTNIDINCNIIRLKDCKKSVFTTCNSVGIYMQQGNNTNDIYTNCIFDSRRAIMVQRFGAITPIPNIINNYMYNYLSAGVTSINHSGTVGGSPQPGRNTFTSNNRAGGAVDITASGFLVTYWCNFGILATSGTVAPSGPCPANAMYSSTSACGNQIVNTKYYKQDQWDICDNYTGKSQIIIFDQNNGDVLVDIGLLSTIKIGEIPATVRLEVALVLINKNDKTNFDKWMQRLAQENGLSGFDLAMLNAKWTYANVGMQNGLAALTAVSATTADEIAEKNVLQTLWDAETNGAVNSAAIGNMSAIDQANVPVSAVARDIIHFTAGNHDYRFGPYFVEPVSNTNNADIFTPYLRLVPNPATTEVRVEFRIAGDGDAVAELFDLTGNKIDIQAMPLGQGAYQFNLKGISSGIYLVSLTDKQTNERQVAKLVVE